MNVLIAEDDAMTRLMLQRAVEHDDHACLVAQDGLEAWQPFQAHRVNVVISDWLMTLVDGIVLRQRVRKQTGSGNQELERANVELARASGVKCALARIAFPSGMNAGVPCEVLLWG